MNNIDEFNKAVVMILTRLYEAFPHQILMDFSSEDEEADVKKLSFYISTVEFLESEGFIRYKSQRLGGIFEGMCLTIKGLRLLNSVPDTLNEKKTLFLYLKEVFKEGSKTAMRAAIDMLFKEAIGD